MIKFLGIILFLNLNFSVENKKKQEFLFFEILDSHQVKKGKYKNFLNKEYLEKNFETFGKDINDFFILEEYKNKFENSLTFLTFNKNFLLNIVIFLSNEKHIEWIETKQGEEKKGYAGKALDKVIEYSEKNNYNFLKLFCVEKDTERFYKRRNFNFINDERANMVLDLEEYRKNKIKKLENSK